MPEANEISSCLYTRPAVENINSHPRSSPASFASPVCKASQWYTYLSVRFFTTLDWRGTHFLRIALERILLKAVNTHESLSFHLPLVQVVMIELKLSESVQSRRHSWRRVVPPSLSTLVKRNNVRVSPVESLVRLNRYCARWETNADECTFWRKPRTIKSTMPKAIWWCTLPFREWSNHLKESCSMFGKFPVACKERTKIKVLVGHKLPRGFSPWSYRKRTFASLSLHNNIVRQYCTSRMSRLVATLR